MPQTLSGYDKALKNRYGKGVKSVVRGMPKMGGKMKMGGGMKMKKAGACSAMKGGYGRKGGRKK